MIVPYLCPVFDNTEIRPATWTALSREQSWSAAKYEQRALDFFGEPRKNK
jgi:hypothetical protein